LFGGVGVGNGGAELAVNDGRINVVRPARGLLFCRK